MLSKLQLDEILSVRKNLLSRHGAEWPSFKSTLVGILRSCWITGLPCSKFSHLLIDVGAISDHLQNL